MFSTTRFEIARKRKRMTAKAVSEAAGVSPVTVSRMVNSQQCPDEQTIDALIAVFDYPRDFFFKDEAELLDPSAASFRSLTSMSARERDAALAAGSLAFEMSDWVSKRFNLPAADLLDLSTERNASAAARLLRQHWSIGERPISSMIKLLESKGVRVFSLAEDTKNVDAFSCWRDGEPYIFLNTYKTAERSRFDAAHELAHLVLHKHGGPGQGRQAEVEAQHFAASFLMPENDIRATLPFVSGLPKVIKAKTRWGVSASALSYRLHKLGILSDWQYRGFCIQINKQFGKTEPDGIQPERSAVWQMILTDLWKEGVSKTHIAADLQIPHYEVENLIFGLTSNATASPVSKSQRTLRMVE